MNRKLSIVILAISLIIGNCTCVLMAQPEINNVPATKLDGLYLRCWWTAFAEWKKQFSTEEEAWSRLKDFDVRFAATADSVIISFLTKPSKKPLGLKGGRSDLGVEVRYEIATENNTIVRRSFFK